MQLMVVCLVFLVGAGLIEGFVSPDPRIPLGARLAIGLTYLALFLLVLSGALGRAAGRKPADGR
jgi:type IV secretory pathway TrbL component